MAFRRKLLVLLPAMAIPALLQLTACFNPDNHFKITASIKVGSRIYSGSGVEAFSCHKAAAWAGTSDVSQCYVRGAAIPVNMGGGRYLFLIIKGPNGDMTSLAAAILRARGEDPFGDATPINLPDRWMLKPGDMPLMVTFTDAHNPASILAVDPGDLNSTLGQDVSQLNVSVEGSSDALSSNGIYSIIPWVNKKNRFEYIRRDVPSFIGNVQYFDFDTR